MIIDHCKFVSSSNNGILYIVATPIGNLGDITMRALETLEKADIIACEDTRVTSKLLSHYSINRPLVSYHQHSRITKIDYLIKELKDGKNIALVTDAGTPGISDPGNILIAKALEYQIAVIPIPGASALTALASVAGIDMQKFVFLGFPPHKKGREKFFGNLENLVQSGLPVICFESSHRILKSLESLKSLNIILGRELTKMFEEIVRGTAEEVLEYFESNPSKVKGEFVIIIY